MRKRCACLGPPTCRRDRQVRVRRKRSSSQAAICSLSSRRGARSASTRLTTGWTYPLGAAILYPPRIPTTALRMIGGRAEQHRTGLLPDAKGRVSGNVGLDRGSGGGICTCTLHLDYTNATLTSLASGHVYRLDPISGDAP